MSITQNFNFEVLINGFMKIMELNVKNLSDVVITSQITEIVESINNVFVKRLPNFQKIEVTGNDYNKFVPFIYQRVNTFVLIVFLDGYVTIHKEVEDFIKSDLNNQTEEVKEVMENVYNLSKICELLRFDAKIRDTALEISKLLERYREKETFPEKKAVFCLLWNKLVELMLKSTDGFSFKKVNPLVEENAQVQIPINYYLTSTPFQCEYQGVLLSIPVNPDTNDGYNFIFDIELNGKKIRLNCYVYCVSDGVFQRDGLNLFVNLYYSKEHVGVITTYPLQIGNREPIPLEFEIKEGIYLQINDQGLVSNDGRKGMLTVMIQLV